MFEPRHAEVPIRSRYGCPGKPKCRRHSFHSGMKGAKIRMPRQAEVSVAFIPQWNERRHVAGVR